MGRPFYTAPSPQAVRDEVKRIAESQATWSDDIVALIRNLEEFSGSSASQIRGSGVSRTKIQHALALEYGASGWEDLIFLCETMEHDDFAQLRNRAKFLLLDHAARHPTAAVRLRKALPALGEMSEGEIFAATITLADAQRTIAREYGFGSWQGLRAFVRSHPGTEGFLNTPAAMPPDVAAMVDAVDAGDAGRLKALIEANPSLVHARVASDITCGDTLLHRADPRATNGGRMTKGHLEVAQLLIDSGIDIDAMGGCGDSCFTPPIDASSWIGNQRMASLLLDNGADPNRSYWTMTKPVRTAANHKGKAIFRMLLKAGAEYTLYETVALGLLKLTRELLDQDTDAVNALDDGALPIVQAAQDVKMTRLLLRYGADPNGQDSRGVTALMEASQAGAKDVVEALLGGGAEPDIFFAIASRDRAAVEKMLATDPHCHRSEAVTPVILAAASGDRTIVEDLLKAGANPNEEQHRWMQDSPLVTAVSHRHEHLVPVLLDYGAEVNPPRAFKWSIPLTAAVRWGTYTPASRCCSRPAPTRASPATRGISATRSAGPPMSGTSAAPRCSWTGARTSQHGALRCAGPHTTGVCRSPSCSARSTRTYAIQTPAATRCSGRGRTSTTNASSSSSSWTRSSNCPRGGGTTSSGLARSSCTCCAATTARGSMR